MYVQVYHVLSYCMYICICLPCTVGVHPVFSQGLALNVSPNTEKSSVCIFSSQATHNQ